ncbi:hypothetical protein KV100_01260 [Mumia sp. zg.B21]|uniref:hypothetical protein n=1 Tax=Mumia sp. zg.B21 TaxID=2855447 RepID=UPI001C6EEA87|nr:hypothetical protein [Mumia sp. zg.B21]MBW9208265.1 hypothetical protein [Mumia sp. zg.B21]
MKRHGVPVDQQPTIAQEGPPKVDQPAKPAVRVPQAAQRRSCAGEQMQQPADVIKEVRLRFQNGDGPGELEFDPQELGVLTRNVVAAPARITNEALKGVQAH